jgi:hypothetical protein
MTQRVVRSIRACRRGADLEEVLEVLLQDPLRLPPVLCGARATKAGSSASTVGLLVLRRSPPSRVSTLLLVVWNLRDMGRGETGDASITSNAWDILVQSANNNTFGTRQAPVPQQLGQDMRRLRCVPIKAPPSGCCTCVSR